MEQQIQNKIIKYLQSVGAYVVKVIAANRAGVPDIIFCYKGKFIALEIKDKSKLTELQKYNINSIVLSGGIAVVVKNIEDVKEIIKKIKE